MHIYKLKDWPNFRWDLAKLAEKLAAVRHHQGRLLGRMEALGFDLQSEAVLHTLTEDVLKSSEIEGESLDRLQVRSSIARRLGIETGALTPAERNVEGVVEMMLDAVGKYNEPLTDERLFAWHSSLFPTGRSGMKRITVGAWRTDKLGPMQVVSGPIGHEHVHYQAPDAETLNKEMSVFIHWLNTQDAVDPVLKAGIAHLWFVIIHPFDDGNGRIARAIADLLLARSEQSSQRFYSMSAQIRKERDSYYDILKKTVTSNLDITDWLEWFLVCLGQAINGAENVLIAVLKKARFWEMHRGEQFNKRQLIIINKLQDRFEGKLTSSKWAKLAKCSQDTALRDIGDLLKRNILIKEKGGGRSTSYTLAKVI